MKSLVVVVLSVIFILGGLWFVTTKISENSPENLKKEFIGKDTKKSKNEKPKTKQEIKKEEQAKDPLKTDYSKLLSHNKELEAQQAKIKELLVDNENKMKENKQQQEDQYVSNPIDDMLDPGPVSRNNVDSVPSEESNEDIVFNLNKWSLGGSSKNVLMVSYFIKNNTTQRVELNVKVVCSGYDSNGDIASTKESKFTLEIDPGQKINYDNEIMGRVNKSAIDFKCELMEDNISVESTTVKQVETTDSIPSNIEDDISAIL